MSLARRMTIDINGNVGIGTASPSSSIDIYKASSQANLELSWGTTAIYLSHGGWGAGEGKIGIGDDFAAALMIDTTTGNVGIGTTNPTNALLDVNGGIYAAGNVSALTFTDRTPIYEGDALTEIKKIKGKDGKIDHSTLPDFVKVDKPVYEDVFDGKATTTIQIATTTERNIGNMVSVNVKAIQQLIERVEALEAEKALGFGGDAELEARIIELENKMSLLDKFVEWIKSIF